MDKTQQLENRIAELEKKWELLQQSSSIPLNLEKALRSRGFLNEKDMFVGATSVSSVPGYIELPYATLNSIVLISPFVSTNSGNIVGEIVNSLTRPNNYALLLYAPQGGTHLIYFAVFNLKDKWLVDND